LLLNHDCNLNCHFCIRGRHANHDYLKFEDLQRILRDNDFHDYYLMLTGGEPALHPQLNEIIDACKSCFKGIAINTNGVESSWVEQCDERRIHVQISLDGTQSVHNQLRGNGIKDIYGSVLETIDKLNRKKISYNISSTVGKYNYEAIKELCKKMDRFPSMKYWKVSSTLPFGCADVQNVISVEQWNELVDYLLTNAKVKLRVHKLFDFDLIDRYVSAHPDEIDNIRTNCGDVKYKIYVYPDFSVYPCTCLTDFPLGNLKDENLENILNGPKGQCFSQYHVKEDTLCHKCKYLPICNGGCIGMSYHFFGELGKGDARCPLIQRELHATL